MEQYLGLIQYNIRPGIVKPEIDSDVKFKINGNFMSKLRLKLFKGIDDENAHEHVRRVLEIVDLFHLPSITHDAVMLRVLPITLSGPALRRKNNLSAGLITKWDLLEKNLKKVDKVVEQSKYMRSLEETIIKFCEESIKKQVADDEWIKKFIKNIDSNLRALKTTSKNLQDKADQLTQMVLTNTSERVKEKTKMGKNDMKEPVPRDLPIEHPYVQPTLIPRTFGQKVNLYKIYEAVCMIKIPEMTHKEKTRVDNGCDITVKDVERLRQLLTPTIHTLPNLEPVVQPYMPQSPFRDKAIC
ncbi:hypothetical protein Tco_0705622 [Tanacetum coccineum]|uniref:Uncharacterized protein n=1 Tax=Tanacetum coccineum TaxID=301880 RepID=A0ABQ4Y6I9_9ASTR